MTNKIVDSWWSLESVVKRCSLKVDVKLKVVGCKRGWSSIELVVSDDHEDSICQSGLSECSLE